MADKVAVHRKVVKRAGLNGARVVAAAMDLADREGIGGLSMRRLAQNLGVETMSLYHYFPSKAELMAAMVGAVYSEYELPAGGSDWRAELRRSALSAHRALLRHPWAAPLVGQPGRPSPLQMDWMDAILGRLRSAGFSAEMTHHAYHAIESHIVGFTLWVLPYLTVADDQPQTVENFIAAVKKGGYRHLNEHIEYHLDDQRQPDGSEFEFGLDLILDGLERLRE